MHCSTRFRPLRTLSVTAALYSPPESQSNMSTIKTEVSALQQVGMPMEYATELDLPFPVAGAVGFRNQTNFHPRRWLLQLAKRIPGDGSYVLVRCYCCGRRAASAVRSSRRAACSSLVPCLMIRCLRSASAE